MYYAAGEGSGRFSTGAKIAARAKPGQKSHEVKMRDGFHVADDTARGGGVQYRKTIHLAGTWQISSYLA